MEKNKKSRKVARTAFSRKIVDLERLLEDENADIADINVVWNVFQTNYEAMVVADNEIYNLLLEADASEDDLLNEMESSEEYAKKYFRLQQKYNKVTKVVEEAPTHLQDSSQSSNVSINQCLPGKRKFKLPSIQFKIFDGNIKEWLSFWSQFKKVHEDQDIDPTDKIEYLIQATVPGSRARQLVESFPATKDNYVKIIDCLTARFGREDLQIEVYVRELLKLILHNAISTNKLDIGILYDKLETQMRALDTLGVKSDKSAAMLFPLIESCLPENILRVWQRSHCNSNIRSLQGTLASLEYPTMEEKLKSLMAFLQNEVENDQRIKLASEGFGLKQMTGRKERSSTNSQCRTEILKQGVPTAAGLVNFNPKAIKCIFCDASHESANCFKAQTFSLDMKKSILNKKNACFCCLKIGHQARKCRAHFLKCVICTKSHYPLMCPNLSINTEQKDLGTSQKAAESTSKELVSVNNISSHVFMQTLRLKLEGVNGNLFVRALIDTGSQRSYILRSTASILGIVSKRVEKIVHCLFGGSLSEQFHQCYDIRLSNGNFNLTKEFLDQPVICSDIPPIFNGKWMNELIGCGIELSDYNNHVNTSSQIDMLIGSDIAGLLYTGRKQVLPCGLVAIETFLGWTLMGKIPFSYISSKTMVDIALFANDATLSQLWDLDVLGIKDPVEKKSRDELALATKTMFLETVTTDNEGRYEVRLPWLEGHPPLSSLYNVAKTRLQNTLIKLKKDNMVADYEKVFQEWLNENIIEEVFEEVRATSNVCYLPHRPVIKEGSTTRIRPVFDASAKIKNQPSLNQCLDKGPNVIELIPNILLRFRACKFGVVSDIRKAFLQISLNEADRDFLRFLWIDSNGREKVFRHRRVVFGVSSSPFLLGATIDYHLSKALEKCTVENVPYTRETILRLMSSFYVDNCVTSVSDDVTLRNFIKESIVLMNEGKFDLRGWEYSGQVNNDISEGLLGTGVLGMMWNKCDDTLNVNETCLKSVNDINDKPISKRLMLSFAHRIFDPIGFTSPSTLLPKLLLQKTWQKNLAWDDPVDSEIENEFSHWLSELHYLTKIKIPRWIHGDNFELGSGSLHVFCDASKDSYASVIFFRASLNGKVFVRLLAAKSRIAPPKKSSIPRLELLAALIGTRLFLSLNKDLQFDSGLRVHFWSDSSTVLSWIRRNENWGTFVGNRVKEIVSNTSIEDWHFVPGVMNPADLPSRGCSPKQLYKSKWWEGPIWLYDEPEKWPRVEIIYNEEEINKEKKKSVTTLLNAETLLVDWHLTYFSKYTKTLRMIGWIFRFLHNVKSPTQKRCGELSVSELDAAEMHIFKLIQKESFDGETDLRLCNLNLFKDECDVIRLRSRICNRNDTEQFRFPVILPAKHILVSRLILEQHIKSLHVGTQSLMVILREKYWIIGGRKAIRSCISSCVICRRHKGKAFVTNLPPLPLNRVRDAAVFEIAGVDFAGPLFLKNGEKAWVCLFTCAVYRAVHLELCTGLSTANFIQVLRRFIARRGRPKTIYSDNGTNFVGTENAFDKLDWNKIIANCGVERISWRFNPPTASWWGGFWERLVGILKQILRKILGRARVTYEDLITILCDCEAIINQRPLTYISNDANEFIPLTPVMFMRELVEVGVPDCDIVEAESLCKNIKHKQQLREHLRLRFRNEYLGQLKSWCAKKPGRQISVGEVVLIGNDFDKRVQWPLGRVVEVIPGKDGQIRLARVDTARGSLLRPVQRLFPLECAMDNSIVENKSVETSSSVEVEKTDSVERVSRSGRVIRVPKRYL